MISKQTTKAIADRSRYNCKTKELKHTIACAPHYMFIIRLESAPALSTARQNHKAIMFHKTRLVTKLIFRVPTNKIENQLSLD